MAAAGVTTLDPDGTTLLSDIVTIRALSRRRETFTARPQVSAAQGNTASVFRGRLYSATVCARSRSVVSRSVRGAITPRPVPKRAE